MKTRILLIVIVISNLVNAQFKNYSNEFLNIGVDARALGMSKAVVASTNDVNATYWNPAGLVEVKDYQGSLMYSSYFAGIANFNYAAFATSIDDKSSLAVSLTRFGVDDILNTTELIDKQGNIDYNRISLFSSVDYAVQLSYAKQLFVKELYVGVNTKIIRRLVGDFASSWGFGFDLGLQYRKADWTFGLMLRDITTTYNSWSIDREMFDKIKNAIPSKNQELPEQTELTKPKVQLGISKEFKLAKSLFLNTELDIDTRFFKTNDVIATSTISLSPSLGLELNYNKMAYLRAGVGNIQKIKNIEATEELSVQPNLGIGFSYHGITVDYAIANIGSVGNALYSNIFSLKFQYRFFR